MTLKIDKMNQIFKNSDNLYNGISRVTAPKLQKCLVCQLDIEKTVKTAGTFLLSNTPFKYYKGLYSLPFSLHIFSCAGTFT